MSDLEELITAADREDRTRQVKREARKKRSPSSAAGGPFKLRWAVLGGTLIVSLISLFVAFRPVSENDIRTDLNAALDAAQSAIGEYQKVSGQLPERIPSAALAGLVEYERLGDGYRLSLTMNGVTATREQ